MSGDMAPTLDLKNINHDVAGYVNQQWAEQNMACPYEKVGERIYFASPRTGESAPILAALQEIGLTNVAIGFVSITQFRTLVEAQKPHFANSLDGVTTGLDVRKIMAEAGLQQELDSGRGAKAER